MNNIRKIRILDALKENQKISQITENNIEHEIVVDDIHSVIEKAVYGYNLSPTSLSPEIRLKQLKGWEAVLESLEKKVLQTLDEIYHISEITASHITAGLWLDQMDTSSRTSKDKKSSVAPSTPQMPLFVQSLISTTDGDFIKAGPNGTQIKKKTLISMNWDLTDANIIRKLLMDIFDRQTLATHTLSGRPSPAFMGCNKPAKLQLDHGKVEDIIYFMKNSLNVSDKRVRQVITTKCADENKMARYRQQAKAKKITSCKTKL